MAQRKAKRSGARKSAPARKRRRVSAAAPVRKRRRVSSSKMQTKGVLGYVMQAAIGAAVAVAIEKFTPVSVPGGALTRGGIKIAVGVMGRKKFPVAAAVIAGSGAMQAIGSFIKHTPSIMDNGYDAPGTMRIEPISDYPGMLADGSVWNSSYANNYGF